MALNYLKMWQHVFKREINSKRLRPANSIIFITYRCTSRCITCNIWQKAQGRTPELKEIELTVPRWTQIIDNLHRAGVDTIEVFGGDALLRKDVTIAMIQKCTDLGMDTFFATNALLLDAETANQLVSAGLGRIYFSLDGIEEIQNRIRGVRQSYTTMKAAIENIYRARSNSGRKKPLIGVITTVSRTNAEEINAIIAHLKRFPLDFVEMQIVGEVSPESIERSVIEGTAPTPLFTATSDHSNLLREEQVPALNTALKSLRKKKREFKFKINLYHIEPYTAETFCKGIFPPLPCHWCTTVVTLTPSGDVVPCPNYTGFILGNVNQEESLGVIWGNEKHRRFLKQQKSGALRICRQCSMRHSYPGVREKFRHTFYRNLYTPFRR